MDSVLDRIGNDSDTSGTSAEGEPRINRKISLKAVVDAIDNSPIKMPPSPRSAEELKRLMKPMPQLIPAPAAFFDKVNDDDGKEEEEEDDNISPKSKSKIVKKERFWEYEEIDERPKEKRKRKLPNELARLQDTEEYLEASKGIKSNTNISERSKRPPRRAAILARENVNFLHGNVENGLELRGTRKALEKEQKEEDESSSEDEKVEKKSDSSFLSNSDLYDDDASPEREDPPKPDIKKKERRPSDDNPAFNPLQRKRAKLEKARSMSDSALTAVPLGVKHAKVAPKSPLGAKKPDFGGIFNHQSPSFKIPKKKSKNPDKERDKEKPKIKTPEVKQEPVTREVEKKKSNDSPKREKKEREDRNGNQPPENQEKWNKRVQHVKHLFNEWVKELKISA